MEVLEKRPAAKPESVKAALHQLPETLRQNERAELASLLEKHKDRIAASGRLTPEIIEKTQQYYEQKGQKAGKLGTGAAIFTATMVGLYNPLYAVWGWLAGKGISAAAKRARARESERIGAAEGTETSKLTPEELRQRNLKIIEEKIRRLRSSEPKR